MTKFETIIRLAEIKGALFIAEDMGQTGVIIGEIQSLMDDLSEEFQEGLPDKNCPEYSIENEQYNFSEKSPFVDEKARDLFEKAARGDLDTYCMHCHRE